MQVSTRTLVHACISSRSTTPESKYVLYFLNEVWATLCGIEPGSLVDVSAVQSSLKITRSNRLNFSRVTAEESMHIFV